ncbi:MAG: InlB B-repeat-containing protein [Acetatifactor sp.]|nr:InlB B-repeat-containing protein [Acetatifactor sp.]
MKNISANLGCDHGICSNVDYWQCHFDSANGVCYCDEDGEDRHDFRDSVTCYVCGAQRDGTPLILVQPKDRIAKANHDVAAAEKVTFSVVAMGTKLTYQWYSGLGTKLTEGDLCYGTKSDTLTVGSSICNADIDEAIAKAEAAGDGRLVNTLVMLKKYNSFYCVVTNAETGKSVTSTTARLSFRHNVIEFRPDNGNSHSANYKVQGGDAVTIKWISSDTHCKVCAGGYYNAPAEEAFVMQAASTCGVHEASEPHVWSRWDYNTEYPAYEGQNGYARRTCLLCKTEEYKAYEYVNPHEHVWSNDAEPITTIVKKTDNQGNVTEVAYEGYHARRCTVEGCQEYTPKEEHLWSAYEITTGATDHSAGERERHCLVCGYVQKETIAPLYHKHDFPVKNPITGWYDLEDMQYVHFSNRMHNVTCRGVVYNEKTGEYEPCGEKANFEQHVLTMDYLDGENDVTCWAEFKFSCPCGFCKKYKSQDYVNYDYDSDRRIGEYRLFSTFPEFQWMFDGMIFYSSGQGNPSKIPNGAVVTIYNETGYRFSEYWWNNCIYTIDDSYIQFIDYDDYHVSFRMPTRDVFADIETLDVSQIPECPHEETYYDLSTAMETTCTESGKDPDLKCRQCHVTLEVGETHAALGHNFILDENTVKWPTCTTRGYTGNSICANCGKLQKGVALPADGHETEDHYSWDENKHWPHCVACDKEFLAKAQKHVFDVNTVSDGVTYEMCSICKYFRIKKGESTGADYEQQVFVNDDSEDTNLRIRFYPVTVSDEDIVRDMEKETSEIGTEYGYLLSDQYNPHDGRYNRVIEYHVLGAPKESIPRKIAITLGKEYVPYIEERTNYNMVGYVRLKEYTVSFQANGGSGSMDGATVKSGEQYTLPACKFTAPSGFAFDCWKIDGVNYQVGAKVTVLKTTNVTAVWKAVHDETDENLKIIKKSLTLYDTIAIEYKIPEAALANYHGFYLMVTQNGVTEKLNDYRTEGGLLIFTYRVAPHMMGEEVTAVPYGLNANNRIVKGEALTYSVEQYCYNMLDKEAYQDAKYATFRRLLVDILRYGDAAQIYMNYKTSELAGKHLTAAQLAMGTDVNVPMTYNSVKNKEFAVVEAGDALASIESVSLYLEAAVNIQFKYVANNLTGLRMVITGDAVGTEVLGEYAANAKQIDDKGRYYASLDNLNAAQMKKTVYATVMKGDKKVSNTYRYSIESYVSAMKGKYSDQLDNLLDSMMRYGNTAADYVAGR